MGRCHAEETLSEVCMAGDPDTVKASLGGETVEVLLDTGSKPFSFISRACAEKHKGHLVRREKMLSGKTLTGTRFECEAYVEAVLQLRGKTIKAYVQLRRRLQRSRLLRLGGSAPATINQAH